MNAPDDDRLAHVRATLERLLASSQTDEAEMLALLAAGGLALDSRSETAGWDEKDELVAHAHLAVYKRVITGLRARATEARLTVDSTKAVLDEASTLVRKRRAWAARRAAEGRRDESSS